MVQKGWAALPELASSEQAALPLSTTIVVEVGRVRLERSQPGGRAEGRQRGERDAACAHMGQPTPHGSQSGHGTRQVAILVRAGTGVKRRSGWGKDTLLSPAKPTVRVFVFDR